MNGRDELDPFHERACKNGGVCGIGDAQAHRDWLESAEPKRPHLRRTGHGRRTEKAPVALLLIFRPFLGRHAFGRRRLTECREDVGRRAHPRRRIGDPQDIGCPFDFDRHIGRHPGLQPQLRIRNVDGRDVADDILFNDWIEPHQGHFPAECQARVRIDPKRHRLAGLDATDVGLRHARVHLHLGEIASDHE